MVTVDDLQGLLLSGGDVVGADGRTIGSVRELFLDAATGRPGWVTVSTRLLGTGESFAPLTGATVRDGALHVAHDRDRVRHAPRVRAPDGNLSPDDERLLLRHYGLLPADDGPGAGGAGSDDTRVEDTGDGPTRTDDRSGGVTRMPAERDDDAPVPPPAEDGDAPAPPPAEGGDAPALPPTADPPPQEPGTGRHVRRDTGTGAAEAGTSHADPGRRHGRHVDPGEAAEVPPAAG